MKLLKLFLLALLVSSSTISCSKDEDDIGPQAVKPGDKRDFTVENFIYKGMNLYYLYKADIPQLANDYFDTQSQLNDFIDNYPTPEDFFYDGVVASQDRFSWIVDDYIELENSFAGITKTSGMSYVLSYYSEDSNNIFGVVRFVEPGTSAQVAGVKRGDIFTKVNGEQLTDTNYGALLGGDSYTLNIASIEENTIIDSGETVNLTTAVYQSNPVYIAKTLTIDGKKIGYLMYNSFTNEFDEQLNTAFGQFKADNVEELILDLRYNSGGDVRTATDLAAMITYQFPGQVFMKEEWNAELQEYWEENDPNGLVNKFNTTLRSGTQINSLMLERVYVLTSSRSASASELIINGLDPYIDVVQVGDKTTKQIYGIHYLIRFTQF
ncbi:S41 family peptidase [Antarcticibacterium sp. 1MA-6-2]|uniref:S41 family peptidase n=1 Tax=Antarcticibacterium sp. 1MA-6-2 TaxID=2908210 RepID=UPI001F215774|nr:S41 family peptidase [Antarcticibacterium sp. 1MA-6-2]UJH91963.1 S41 family peptidase [Antarcticibacterium sp. 1MA-6-2]